MSICCKEIDLIDDDVDDDEYDPKLADPSEWQNRSKKRKHKQRASQVHPINDRRLEWIRQMRVYELELWFVELSFL